MAYCDMVEHLARLPFPLPALVRGYTGVGVAGHPETFGPSDELQLELIQVPSFPAPPAELNVGHGAGTPSAHSCHLMYRTRTNSTLGLVRWVHAQALRQLERPQKLSQVPPKGLPSNDTRNDMQEALLGDKAKRNAVGVQLLSRTLHEQIFRGRAFPPPDPVDIQIAHEHLNMHGIDLEQGAILPDIGFTLPPLQGRNLDQHFHRIGSQTGEPWISLAKSFADATLPPIPSHWDIRSGWTKYHHLPDGSSHSEPVEYPMHDGKPEQLLSFDLEAMHRFHPYSIMATAASPNGWYAWISPWLLGKTDDPNQLIPMGDPTVARVIIGHNVSYDRRRIKEEYHLEGTKNRFVDTMALHAAIMGISNGTRPFSVVHKVEQTDEDRAEQAQENVEHLIDCLRRMEARETDPKEKDALKTLRLKYEQGNTCFIPGTTDPTTDAAEAQKASNHWEKLTSWRSLTDVAQYHCDIEVDKSTRNDFMTKTPEEIRVNIPKYLEYCANDTDITHRVFVKALPAFLEACPHPVSFSAILTMGSGFLPLTQEWDAYIDRADRVYQQMEDNVKIKLKTLAEKARVLVDVPGKPERKRWKKDPWLSQLDWTPKLARELKDVEPAASDVEVEPEPQASLETEPLATAVEQPTWFHELSADPLNPKMIERVIPLLLKLSYDGHPLVYTAKERWHFLVDGQVTRIATSSEEKRASQILCPRHAGTHLQSGRMQSWEMELAVDMANLKKPDGIEERVVNLARRVLDESDQSSGAEDPWLSQLDWTPCVVTASSRLLPSSSKTALSSKRKPSSPEPVYWPQWYWEATASKNGVPAGTLYISLKSRIAPLLMKLTWLGWPLFYSSQHGWTFRVPPGDTKSVPDIDDTTASPNIPFTPHAIPLEFDDPADEELANDVLHSGFTFHRLPHPDLEYANVVYPISKMFMKHILDGRLKSAGDEMKEFLEFNRQCSYWTDVRDRIQGQLVVWQKEGEKGDLGFEVEKRPSSLDSWPSPSSPATTSPLSQKWGITLPQTITMGTVTRQPVENTWLPPSIDKPNQVGSELKRTVRAPPGYSIVGANFDTEEERLWILGCLGDAQFGMHGATALGWMAAQGTQASGTDLHSKTAAMLGITRDQAKALNSSRVEGAGLRHALLLLLQANPKMPPDEAYQLAELLHLSTKGKNTQRMSMFDTEKLWYGGSESFAFNTLEGMITVSKNLKTPVLGCRIAKWMITPSGMEPLRLRIKGLIQSSGVDYLHLLIVSMNHLIAKYDIKARYLISLNGELRYLVKNADRYRAALALQIATLWTRCFVAYRLGMDDLPQSMAFLPAVDVDWVLRKDAHIPCVTLSPLTRIPPGERLDIVGVLEKTNGGNLRKHGTPMADEREDSEERSLEEMPEGYVERDPLVHRANSAVYLRAQATQDLEEVMELAKWSHERSFADDNGYPIRQKMNPRKKITSFLRFNPNYSAYRSLAETLGYRSRGH